MNTSGAQGEAFATEFLREEGYIILARNYHTRYGELDIVAQQGDLIAFVEVKTRASNALSCPAASVTPQKQRRLLKTALYYLAEHPLELQPRFDVFEVVLDGGGLTVQRYQHIKGAFDLNETNRID